MDMRNEKGQRGKDEFQPAVEGKRTAVLRGKTSAQTASQRKTEKEHRRDERHGKQGGTEAQTEKPYPENLIDEAAAA